MALMLKSGQSANDRIADICSIVHNPRMIAGSHLLSTIILASAALLNGTAAAKTRRPSPPPRLELIDPNSDAARQAMIDELRSAREAALHAKPSVIRMFLVGSELHYGYYLISTDNLEKITVPDLLDQRVRDVFDVEMHPDVMMNHMGERLRCECSGIPWNFLGEERFIVQSANLTWVK